MSILREIQRELLSDDAPLGSILLKLRFLASRLGGDLLEDWVKYETQGYPREAEVPEYRIIGIVYSGTFAGPFNSGLNNVPIPNHLVEKFAGEQWTRQKVRQSITSVEELAKTPSGNLGIDASDLILLLQGKIYERYACISINATVSPVAMREIMQNVRSRVLELTLEFEKKLPEAASLDLGGVFAKSPTSGAITNQIFHQTIHGNVSHVNAQQGSNVVLAVSAGDLGSLIASLNIAGVPSGEAKELAQLISSEAPGNSHDAVSKRVMSWIKKNAPKVANGAWKIGSEALTQVVTEAALRYYNLKH